MKVTGIIPARFGSTRFPGKPLTLIAGKPLIQHVVERCQKAKSLSEIIVATDDELRSTIWNDLDRWGAGTGPARPGMSPAGPVLCRSGCDREGYGRFQLAMFQ